MSCSVSPLEQDTQTSCCGRPNDRGIRVDRAHVIVEAETENGGRKPGHLAVSVRVETNADEPAIMELIEHTDRVSEVLKSLRLGTPVRLADARAPRQAMMRFLTTDRRGDQASCCSS